MPLENLNCPRCGAILQVTTFTSITTCDFCKSTIRVSTIQTNEQTLTKNNFPIAIHKPEDSPWFDDIYDALARMLKSHESSSFVIFYERNSKKSVKFCQPLIINFPFKPLSTGETERATAFFLDLGVLKPEIISQSIFYKYDFGQDVKLATQITLEIFRQIYKFPINFDLDYDEE